MKRFRLVAAMPITWIAVCVAVIAIGIDKLGAGLYSLAEFVGGKEFDDADYE